MNKAPENPKQYSWKEIVSMTRETFLLKCTSGIGEVATELRLNQPRTFELINLEELPANQRASARDSNREVMKEKKEYKTLCSSAWEQIMKSLEDDTRNEISKIEVIRDRVVDCPFLLCNLLFTLNDKTKDELNRQVESEITLHSTAQRPDMATDLFLKNWKNSFDDIIRWREKLGEAPEIIKAFKDSSAAHLIKALDVVQNEEFLKKHKKNCEPMTGTIMIAGQSTWFGDTHNLIEHIRTMFEHYKTLNPQASAYMAKGTPGIRRTHETKRPFNIYRKKAKFTTPSSERQKVRHCHNCAALGKPAYVVKSHVSRNCHHRHNATSNRNNQSGNQTTRRQTRPSSASNQTVAFNASADNESTAYGRRVAEDVNRILRDNY